MIERVVRHRDARRQFRFATQAEALVPHHSTFVVAKSHRGLHLLAQTESDLQAPLRTLQTVYGARMQVKAERRGQPMVEVRIGVERRYLAAVREELLRRGENPSEEYIGPHHCVLRFDASPAALLGLRGELARLTSGTASQDAVLSRYAQRRPNDGSRRTETRPPIGQPAYPSWSPT